jgi:hypothetical protein
VIFGLGLRPDLLHRLDPLAPQLETAFEHGAVVLHFILVPAADPEQKAAVRHLIYRGDELGRLDRVALLHQGQK